MVSSAPGIDMMPSPTSPPFTLYAGQVRVGFVGVCAERVRVRGGGRDGWVALEAPIALALALALVAVYVCLCVYACALAGWCAQAPRCL